MGPRGSHEGESCLRGRRGRGWVPVGGARATPMGQWGGARGLGGAEGLARVSPACGAWRGWQPEVGVRGAAPQLWGAFPCEEGQG